MLFGAVKIIRPKTLLQNYFSRWDRYLMIINRFLKFDSRRFPNYMYMYKKKTPNADKRFTNVVTCTIIRFFREKKTASINKVYCFLF